MMSSILLPCLSTLICRLQEWPTEELPAWASLYRFSSALMILSCGDTSLTSNQNLLSLSCRRCGEWWCAWLRKLMITSESLMTRRLWLLVRNSLCALDASSLISPSSSSLNELYRSSR
uniref:Putative secreted protein n=1 Tax=Ixodes ricinus TaxID=34613 RepID=A0A6B0ULV3_IXORI